MVTTILTHEVKNYTDWRVFFDLDEPNRRNMGVKIKGVYQAVENPNMITIISEVPSIEDMNKFLSNPDLKEIMMKAGVIGMPEVKILSSAN